MALADLVSVINGPNGDRHIVFPTSMPPLLHIFGSSLGVNCSDRSQKNGRQLIASRAMIPMLIVTMESATIVTFLIFQGGRHRHPT